MSPAGSNRMRTAADLPAIRDFAQRLDLDARVEPFRVCRWDGVVPKTPVLHLEDVSAIPFLVDIAGVEEYQHRARLRAKTGDLYATVTPGDPRHERYCREQLGLGEVEWLDARGDANPLAVARGCRGGTAFTRLVQAARRSGELVIHPYMSIDDVWDLAADIADEAHVPTAVLGPPPPVTWIANDKALFTELVTIVLGPGWVPETHDAAEPSAMAERLHALAARYGAVGLKRTRCASAMGNVVFDAPSLRTRTPAQIETDVRRFLQRTEWPGDEPVLVVAWEDARFSPSTQWWIPPAGQGPPRLDGIYEQILEGDRKVFVGSRPASLPPLAHQTLSDAAARVAAALQELGYVGRASFDHLILDEEESGGGPRIRFTECNGRWGGTSTPMVLVDRVVDGPRPPYRAQDFVHPRLVGLTFEEILARLGDQVFDRRSRRGRYLLYNVGPLSGFGKLDVIAIGAHQSDAEQALLSDLPRLLHL